MLPVLNVEYTCIEYVIHVYKPYIEYIGMYRVCYTPALYRVHMNV